MSVGIWSGKNVLKHAFLGTSSMPKPNTSDGGLGFFTTKVITHDLGYRPIVRAHYDPSSNGSVFPTVGQYSGVGGRSVDSPFDARSPEIVPFSFFVDDITTTSVIFRTYSTSALVGTFSFYYRIYRDPTL